MKTLTLALVITLAPLSNLFAQETPRGQFAPPHGAALTRSPNLSQPFAATALATSGQNRSKKTLNLLPPPQEIQFSGDKTLRARSDMRIIGNTESVAAVRNALAERVDPRTLPQGRCDITIVRPLNPADKLWQNDQAYLLKVEASGITIEAGDNKSAFYAAQTLAQLIQNSQEIPLLEIRDWPAIQNRLIMIATDQGGFQVIDIDYWKRLIRELAAFKINAVMPYFDSGTYRYGKYPFLGAKGDDGFTREKAQILSDYAAEHFVRLIPQQNSIGHLGGLLGHKQLRHLRDGGGTINMVAPETLTFLGDLYDELVEAFPHSTAIHVGGDEFSHGFGENPRVAARIAEIGEAALYAEFMTKLRDMLKKRDRSMMIWWNEKGLTLEAAALMPKEIAVFDWHYNARKDYPSLDNLLKAGFENPWATPAVTRYYSRGNDWNGTFANIHNFAVAGLKRGVPGICTCTWVHGMWGGRNMFELNLYGVVYSAECGWNPTPAIETADFAKKFALRWLGCRQTDAAKWIIDGIHRPYGESKKQQKFWYDNRALETYAASSLTTLMRQIDESPSLETEARSLLNFCDQADAALDALSKAAQRNQRALKYYKHDVRIHRLVADRLLTAAEMRRWSSGLKIAKATPEKELLKLEFKSSGKNDFIKIDPETTISNGTLKTIPRDKWKRGGLTVGPIPMPENGALVEYDLKALQYGQQFQQLASMKPSTHHYMAFIGAGRRFHLHVRSENNWSSQNAISSPCSTGKWYRCAALIRQNSLSFRVRERDGGRTIFRSDMVPIDNVGAELMFNLADCHDASGRSAPATVWDNITVSSLSKVPEMEVAVPKTITTRLTRLVADHNLIEEGFRNSVLEAGGGSADTGNLSKGAMRFRGNQGRKDIERLLDNLKKGFLPASFMRD